MRTSRVAAPMLILLLSTAVGACSGTTGGAAGTTGAPAPVAAATQPPVAAPAATPATAPAATGAPTSDSGKGAYGEDPATPAAAAGGLAVGLGDTSLGKVLVDGAGLTLYVFTPDGGGKSACNGDCAVNWPPLKGGAAPTLGAGLDAGNFASITRDDGTAQVTFYGLPLYHFAGDKAAGDVSGQGLAGKWYVVGADGKPVK